MAKEELINEIRQIDEQMEKLRKCYEPFVGKRLDSLSIEDQERVRKFWILVQRLTNAKHDLRTKAISEFGIFVM